ncbi:MAG: endonuclease/exonuclease/phosphatase family protein [Ruminococcaceae bacterium]|nr:endonuclease/exonuclease/phosphatase family protein [Oscillospiraceae bacterium]
MKKSRLIVLAVLLLCLGMMSMSGCSARDPLTLRIGSYNIKNGELVNHEFKAIADDILSKDLDIVGLQEVDKFCVRSKFADTMELLKEYTGMQYYAYFKCIDLYGDEDTYGEGGAYGTAILSKYPITETDEIELNNGKTVERRLLTHAAIDVDGTVVNFYNTHLTIASDAIRQSEFRIVANTVKDKENCILVGDFNVDSYGEFEVLKPLTYINNPETDFITHPEGDRKIDNICFSSEFSLAEDAYGLLENHHSDHVMLYAELELSGQ